MAQKSVPTKILQETLTALYTEDSKASAAKALGIPANTYKARLTSAEAWLLTKEGKAWKKKFDKNRPATSAEIQVRDLTSQLSTLNRALRNMEKDNLTTEAVRSYIFELSRQEPKAPAWVNNRKKFPYHHGVPTLFLSDIHYGEVVIPAQVFNSNKFNSDICRVRIQNVVDTTIGLLKGSVLQRPDYPGIVLILGGDMINGDIHDELKIGSDRRVMEQTIEIADIIHACILKLAKEFGKVFVVGVPGNHGRSTRKPMAKFYAETNFDWLVYQMLERFLGREVLAGWVTFLTPPARDVTFRIAGRGYRLTHGDQFRGGDSIIGPLGPITRGDKKKRAVAMSLPRGGEGYDTLLVGHFHTYLATPSLIMNGSIKGYDEYAMSINVPYEPPQQACWLTHEKFGINHYLPILADDNLKGAAQSPAKWVEFGHENQSHNVQRMADLMGWAL